MFKIQFLSIYPIFVDTCKDIIDFNGYVYDQLQKNCESFIIINLVYIHDKN